MDYLYMFVQWFVILLIRIPMAILGLAVVAIGLLFEVRHPETKVSFTQHHTDRFWELVNLPKVFWLWDNARDGGMGDRRGWWNKESDERGYSAFMSKWWWMAVRNPTNNLTRQVRGINAYMPECPVTVMRGKEYVDDKIGYEGFSLLKAKGPTFNYYHLYYVAPSVEGISPWIIRIGHKIKMSHNDTDWMSEPPEKRMKGFTFRISYNVDIS